MSDSDMEGATNMETKTSTGASPEAIQYRAVSALDCFALSGSQ
jgi:hypothetical protein